jgi:hypothetical protein
VGSSRFMLAMVIDMHWGDHWGDIRLAKCFRGIAHIHHSCLLNALSGYQGNTVRCLGALGVNLCIVFYMLRTCFRCRLGQLRYSYLCICSLRVGLRVGCAYAWAAIHSQTGTQPTTFWQDPIGVIGQHATQRYPKLMNCFRAIAQINSFYCVL